MLIPKASNSAQNVDSTLYYILSVEVILLALVTFAMIFFVVKYNRRKNANPQSVEGGIFLEILWTVIPTLLVLGMFYLGWRSFVQIRKVPEDALVIGVTARQWSWQFRYDNGKQSDTLRVPLDRPVKLILKSQDVLHSFSVPAFRIKEDCVPGMETYLWFTAKEAGSYDIFCTEYCGLGHSAMLSKVVVLSDRDFHDWYRGREGEEVSEGLKLLEGKGCLGCHTTDGTKKIGPTFKGVYGRAEDVLTDGKERKIVVDESYLRRSILEPHADIVKGYPPIMPVIPVTKEELDVIIEYMKNLK
ncbi:MAG TPA: cytochrome c oxidase subunit II [Thermodesulfovibrionales bacterium]|jgi:cytochrome c oxidase subunit 2|nr:cytochrome c oxidase subunit II [Thermodesulfovibrionales bacterium]